MESFIPTFLKISNMPNSTIEADILFGKLNSELSELVDPQYFSEPKEFRFTYSTLYNLKFYKI